jgi:hypothetical protein
MIHPTAIIKRDEKMNKGKAKIAPRLVISSVASSFIVPYLRI